MKPKYYLFPLTIAIGCVLIAVLLFLIGPKAQTECTSRASIIESQLSDSLSIQIDTLSGDFLDYVIDYGKDYILLDADYPHSGLSLVDKTFHCGKNNAFPYGFNCRIEGFNVLRNGVIKLSVTQIERPITE